MGVQGEAQHAGGQTGRAWQEAELYPALKGVWFSQVGLVVKNPPANAGDVRDTGLIPGFGRSPREGHGNPGFLPGESHGQRSLAGYSPRGHKESDTNEAT